MKPHTNTAILSIMMSLWIKSIIGRKVQACIEYTWLAYCTYNPVNEYNNPLWDLNYNILDNCGIETMYNTF